MNVKRKLNYLFTLTASATALMACQSSEQSVAEQTEKVATLNAKTFAEQYSAQAAMQFPFGQLLVSEKQGLTLVADESKQLSSDSFEFLAPLDGQALTLNLSTKQLQLVSSTASGVMLNSAGAVDLAVEGLCATQQSQDQIDVVLLTEQGLAHQWIVKKQPGNNGWQSHAIREFNLPPGSEYCAIDAASGQILVNEEGTAIWAYPLDPEAEMKRSAIDVVAPFGHLKTSASALWVKDGNLFSFELGDAALHHYRFDNSAAQYRFVKTLPISNAMEVEFLHGEIKEQSLVLSLYDDGTESLFNITLPAPESGTIDADQFAQVRAYAETPPMQTQGDAADDPAIWVNQQAPAKSRVLGTNKKQGLFVYDLAGAQVQQLLVGRVNNVDVRSGFTLQGQPMDVAAASHRDHNSIALFAIQPETGKLSVQAEIQTNLDDVYGLCMGSQAADIFVFINDQDGRYQQYKLIDSDTGWSGQLVREFKVATQPEGCVSFDQKGILFVGEEDHGIWTLDLTDPKSELQEIATVNGHTLVDDIEGLDLYLDEDKPILVVSSQGNDSYVLMDAVPPYAIQGRFKVVADASAGIDGASETDGLAVTSAPLGKGLEQGLMVVQDGRNVMPAELQNFKLISFSEVLKIVQ